MEGNGLAVRGNLVDFQVVRRPVIAPDQIFQTGLDGFPRHFFSVGKGNVIPQLEFQCMVVDLRIGLGQPRLDIHFLVEFEERFPYAIADGAPAAVGVMGVGTGVLHGRSVGHGPVMKYFSGFFRRAARTRAAAAYK